jgi:integrase
MAQAIRDVRGEKQQGVRAGNWLTKKQAEDLINSPDTSTMKGKRDRAILAVLIGCGLRREEVARLSLDHIQQRDGRWCVVDLVGKHGRIRTVPMPSWTKAAIDAWAAAAEISAGPVFRGVNKGDHVTGESLTAQGVLRCVGKYSKVAPHDLRRTYAKLAHKGGAKLDQIQLSLGHASLTTTERYLGVHQDLNDAPCDYLHLDLAAARE